MFQKSKCHESGLTLLFKVFHLSMARRIEGQLDAGN